MSAPRYGQLERLAPGVTSTATLYGTAFLRVDRYPDRPLEVREVPPLSVLIRDA